MRRERETERETDRQTDIQTDRWTVGHADRLPDSQSQRPRQK